MSKTHVKHQGHKSGGKVSSGNTTDIFFYVLAVAAVVAALYFVPQFIGATGVSFLAAGSGLNKLVAVIVAVVAGWACLLPSQGYKSFVELAKGARIEWKKTVKPDRDTVLRTTMMVLLLVVFFAILILILDWLFGSVLRTLVS